MPIASAPTLVTGYWRVYDKAGGLEVNARIHLRASDFPENSTGIILEDSLRTALSDGDGVVYFPNLFPGVTYIVFRAGSKREAFVTVPVGAADPVALGSIVG